jgi:ABC-type multidrug transport system fused ATPase/permease subunit
LSTIRKASCIYVVKDGRIVQFGTHDELLEKGGVYKELHDIQFNDQAEPAATTA